MLQFENKSIETTSENDNNTFSINNDYSNNPILETENVQESIDFNNLINDNPTEEIEEIITADKTQKEEHILLNQVQGEMPHPQYLYEKINNILISKKIEPSIIESFIKQMVL